MKVSEKKDFDLGRELKKTLEHESDHYTNRDWWIWYSN